MLPYIEHSFVHYRIFFRHRCCESQMRNTCSTMYYIIKNDSLMWLYLLLLSLPSRAPCYGLCVLAKMFSRDYKNIRQNCIRGWSFKQSHNSPTARLYCAIHSCFYLDRVEFRRQHVFLTFNALPCRFADAHRCALMIEMGRSKAQRDYCRKRFALHQLEHRSLFCATSLIECSAWRFVWTNLCASRHHQ